MLPRNLLNEVNQIPGVYNLYCVCENLSTKLFFGSGSGTVINYGPVLLRQKVAIPPVPVPQHCPNFPDIFPYVWLVKLLSSMNCDFNWKFIGAVSNDLD